MASGPIFQTTVRLELPVWVRRPNVKDDSLVETVSQLMCEGEKKERWNRGGRSFMAFLATREIHTHFGESVDGCCSSKIALLWYQG